MSYTVLSSVWLVLIFITVNATRRLVMDEVTPAECDYKKVSEYMRTNTSAIDDHAVLCADSTPRTSFALLFQACPGVNYHFKHWKRLQKVQGDCTSLRKGQALINYYKQYALAGGVFVECLNGTDIKVALQNCDPVHFLVVDNATLYESYIYTVDWNKSGEIV